MTDLTTIARAYVAAWNATDEVDRKRLMQAAFTSNASYRDPHNAADGHEGIDAMIAEVHKRFPGYGFSLKGTPDGYAEMIRFSWAMTNGGAESLVEGTDIDVIENGRLAKVTGFLDKVPAQQPTLAAASSSAWRQPPASSRMHRRRFHEAPFIAG